MDNRFTGLIRIVSAPSGEAELGVRKAWIGIELSCFHMICQLLPIHHEELGGSEVQGLRTGYLVPQDEALSKLRDFNLGAYHWWLSMGYPKGKDRCFVFEPECVEVLSGISEGIHVPKFTEYCEHNGDLEK